MKNNTSGIIVAGSLSPNKKVQDRVRVLSIRGVSVIKSDRLQRSTENTNQNSKKSGIIRLIHRGTGGEQGWIFSTQGIMATIPSSCFKDPPKIVVKV